MSNTSPSSGLGVANRDRRLNKRDGNDTAGLHEPAGCGLSVSRQIRPLSPSMLGWYGTTGPTNRQSGGSKGYRKGNRNSRRKIPSSNGSGPTISAFHKLDTCCCCCCCGFDAVCIVLVLGIDWLLLFFFFFSSSSSRTTGQAVTPGGGSFCSMDNSRFKRAFPATDNGSCCVGCRPALMIVVIIVNLDPLCVSLSLSFSHTLLPPATQRQMSIVEGILFIRCFLVSSILRHHSLLA